MSIEPQVPIAMTGETNKSKCCLQSRIYTYINFILCVQVDWGNFRAHTASICYEQQRQSPNK